MPWILTGLALIVIGAAAALGGILALPIAVVVVLVVVGLTAGARLRRAENAGPVTPEPPSQPELDPTPAGARGGVTTTNERVGQG
jgi:hypothetical protein